MTRPLRGRSTVCGVLMAAILLGGTTIARAQSSTLPCYSYDENCKGIIKKTAIIGGIMLGALIVWKIAHGTHKRSQQNAAPDELNVYYDPTSGTALNHMVMQLRAVCPGTWSASDATQVSGKLPPGLTLQRDRTISGTPLGVGVWQTRIEVSGLKCEGRNGKTKTYADRTLNVSIKIE